MHSVKAYASPDAPHIQQGVTQEHNICSSCHKLPACVMLWPCGHIAMFFPLLCHSITSTAVCMRLLG